MLALSAALVVFGAVLVFVGFAYGMSDSIQDNKMGGPIFWVGALFFALGVLLFIVKLALIWAGHSV